MNHKIFINQKGVLTLIPRSSGIYFFYDKSGNLLYIGIAKVLRSRISSHKTNSINRTSRTQVIDKVYDRIYWIEITEMGYPYLLEYETYLIRKLNPLLNIESGRDIYFAFENAELIIDDVMLPVGLE